MFLNDYFEFLTCTKLDPLNKPEDKQLVHDYWTHLDENQEVEGLKAAEVVAMCIYYARIGKDKEFIRK